MQNKAVIINTVIVIVGFISYLWHNIKHPVKQHTNNIPQKVTVAFYVAFQNIVIKKQLESNYSHPKFFNL